MSRLRTILLTASILNLIILFCYIITLQKQLSKIKCQIDFFQHIDRNEIKNKFGWKAEQFQRDNDSIFTNKKRDSINLTMLFSRAEYILENYTDIYNDSLYTYYDRYLRNRLYDSMYYYSLKDRYLRNRLSEIYDEQFRSDSSNYSGLAGPFNYEFYVVSCNYSLEISRITSDLLFTSDSIISEISFLGRLTSKEAYCKPYIKDSLHNTIVGSFGSNQYHIIGDTIKIEYFRKNIANVNPIVGVALGNPLFIGIIQDSAVIGKIIWREFSLPNNTYKFPNDRISCPIQLKYISGRMDYFLSRMKFY